MIDPPLQNQAQLIIQSHYDPSSQSLNLCPYPFYAEDCNTYWNQILTSQEWDMIQNLNLSWNSIDDEQATEIAKLNWPKVMLLNLNTNQLTAKGIQSLLSNQWPELYKLFLDQNKIGSEGFIKLLNFSFKNLRSFFLRKNKIVCNKLVPLPSDFMAEKLTFIDLSDNKIGSFGIKILTKASLPKLQHLKLRNCQINNESASHLVKGKWSALSQLILQNNKIGLNGFTILFGYNKWPKLYEFAYRKNNMGMCAFDQIMVAKWSELSVKTVDSDSFKNSFFRGEVLSLYRRKFGD